MSFHANVSIRPANVIGEIDPRIYGQYIENVEPDDRVIYGGVCDDTGQLRAPVLEALRRMQVPVVRWGGNYGDLYRWQDGIGPREQRPRRPNYFWGGEESNRFGTHEFLELCNALNAQPYININMGTGNLLEALGWLEYCNYSGNTHYTALRRQHGQAEPWKVPVWGIGNEAWGHWETCFAAPDDYIHRFNQYAQYMRRLDPEIEVVAVGHTDRLWNRAVLSGMPRPADYLSVHLYGHSHLDRPENFEQLVGLPVAFEQELAEVVRDLETYAAESIALTIDEWNVRHFVGGRLNRKSPRLVQDAIFVAGVFHAMHRFSKSVKMGNYVTMVNGNAPLRAWDEAITPTPLYDVFRLYQQFMTGATVGVDVASPEYEVRPFDWVSTPHQRDGTLSVPYIDASAAVKDANGVLSLAIINRHSSHNATVTVQFDSQASYSFQDATLLAGDNPTALEARVTDTTSSLQSGPANCWTIDLPPYSIMWMQWHE